MAGKHFVVWSLTVNFVHSAGAPKSKIQFNGVGGLRTYVSLTASPFQRIIEALLMSNSSVKVAIALFMALTPPAASFARGGHGGGHAGSAAMGGFARPAGSAGTGNVPISGIARGPANAGGMNNEGVDPSGIGNAFRMRTLQPNIAAPTLPGGSRNPAAPLSMNLNQQALPEALGGGGRQPRADQVPSEQGLMDPNDPINKENAALDRMINGICRGC
jgi:hypothetical protein